MTKSARAGGVARARKILMIGMIAFFTSPGASASFVSDTYNPLAVSDEEYVKTADIVVHDTTRDRDIPVLIYLPQLSHPAPVVLFSHGLGGTRNGSAYLGKHWAARGYVAVFVQHLGSDEAVWKDKSKIRGFLSMKKAANGDNFLLRVKDIPAVLDQLTTWNSSHNHILYNKLDMQHIGMSGHSFGAVTTQAVGGQEFNRFSRTFNYTDPRIKAAIAFSPSAAKNDPKESFASVAIPWLLMTGTLDEAPIGNADVANRLSVYPALPTGGKYELVLNDAQHSAFTDHVIKNEKVQRNPNHHRAILALSTAFWDSYLKENEAAKIWLDGDNAASVLEAKDRWQSK